MELRDTDLQRRKVITSDGKEIGVGAGVYFDPASFKVTAVAVKLHPAATKEVGAKKPLFGRAELRIPVEGISGIADAIILRATLASLHNGQR